MFNLLPKDTVFYDLFEGLATHAVSCAGHLHTLASCYPDQMENIARIRQEEHEADQLTHQALERLDRTFITPFDREDIHALVGELDSIVDNINALAKRLSSYHVRSLEPAFIKQAEILMQATIALAEAVKKLRVTRKLTDLQAKIIEVHRLENVGDDNHLAAISKLFEPGTDPLHVIKWKEFFQFLEAAIDGCEDATNVIERIILKNG
jgi:predicted phosphate transport protein (TIGR00153 family)